MGSGASPSCGCLGSGLAEVPQDLPESRTLFVAQGRLVPQGKARQRSAFPSLRSECPT